MATALSALVVDDDELVRTAIVRQLKNLGATRVEIAADGPGALAALDQGVAFGVIICDLMLPGIDGVEFLRDASQRQPGAALVLMSALDERVLRSVAVLSRERGLRVIGALRKPVRMEALATLIGALAEPARGAPAGPRAGAAEIGRAIERGDILLHVQPKVQARDGRLHSVECLARWTDPRLGAVPPGELARAAERGGLTATLTEYVLDRALATCARWQQAGLRVPVSVNLTGVALRRLDLPDFVERLLRTHGVPAPSLIVEIGEAMLADDTSVLDVLSRLRMREVRISMDNFGTGQGSLVRLQRLPLTEVKIDRSFVRCLPGGTVANTVVEYSVRLAHALGLESVAVGVESEEQAQLLREFGCDVLQGRLVGEVMPADALPAWAGARAAAPPAAAAVPAAAAAAAAA